MEPIRNLDPRQAGIEQLLRCCHTRKYPAKNVIIRPGDAGDILYYIVEGSVSVNIADEERGEIVLAYLNKGDFIGEMGIFIGATSRAVTVTTRQTCQLAEISYKRFKDALGNELKGHAVELLFAIGEHLANRLTMASRKVGHLAFLDVTGRIAGTLIDLCRQPDAMTHPDGMQLKITRQEIGRIVGCSREMAGRVLKEMEEKGLITAKGKTVVVFGTR